MTITFNDIDHPRAATGEFTEKGQSAPELTLSVLDSEFIASSIANQEAAAWVVGRNQWATTSEFEDKLFDTYDTRESYDADLADAESELNLLRNQLGVVELPSGGVAVFFD